MAKILVVDDDPNMRVSLCEALARCGYDVESAPDAVTALRQIETKDYRVVITDIRMPGRSGLELLDDVKASRPETSVILITAYGTVETAVEAIRKGADDYLLKPFGVDVLNDTIRRILNGGAPAEVGRASAPAQLQPRPADNGKQIITKNPKMLQILQMAERTANSSAPVLIQGESGTGKELMARFIHNHSGRSEGAFVAINCAALPENLLESELFGYEKGAFTGAVNRKIGKFELADGGTLLLDEVTEMDINLQAKLLRVLQEKEIDRVGGSAPVKVDTRVIATTNRVPEDAIREGKFRKDLFFRLNVIPLTLLPLRERPEDIPVLAEFFLKKFSVESARDVRAVSPATMYILKKCKWGGNVRELENVLERAVLLCHTDVLEPEDLFLSYSPEGEQSTERPENLPAGMTMEEMERRLILGTLEKTQNNRTRAAEMLGISIRTLRNKLNAYKIDEKGK
ncbi:MAG: sigma-54-dependent Fis family transcriptional regulator [Nitrospinae bacterium]|nr:sigma-54-dependent Fis family transcriptional regulator [Nitrospinota bacterium]